MFKLQAAVVVVVVIEMINEQGAFPRSIETDRKQLFDFFDNRRIGKKVPCLRLSCSSCQMQGDETSVLRA